MAIFDGEYKFTYSNLEPEESFVFEDTGGSTGRLKVTKSGAPSGAEPEMIGIRFRDSAPIFVMLIRERGDRRLFIGKVKEDDGEFCKVVVGRRVKYDVQGSSVSNAKVNLAAGDDDWTGTKGGA